MSNKTEYFNAKSAGDYLGDQWVVRGSDFDNLESYHNRLREALDRLVRSCDNLEYEAGRVSLASSDAEDLLGELDNMENGS